MLERTNIPEVPWYLAEGTDKSCARLNCIDHLLGVMPYHDVPHDPIILPERDSTPTMSERFCLQSCMCL